jgi:hypothetical protein
MNIAIKIIHRSLVIEFYKQNAAFFGLILLVFFGFIKSSEHIAIGTFLISNPGALFILYLFWLAYTIKVMFFLWPAINKNENQFLSAYLILDNNVKFATVVTSSASLLIPVLLYAIFLISLTFHGHFVSQIISISGCSILLILGLSYYIHLRLCGLPHEKSVFQLRLFKKVTIHPILFFALYLLRNETVLLLLTKTYSGLIIIGTAALYGTEDFDLRVMTTGILLSSIGNVAIMHKYVWFQYEPMSFSLNLPLNITKIIFKQIANIFLISIPELLILIRHYPLHLNAIDIFGLFLLSIAICYFLYSWMITKQVELSKSMVVVFWLVVGNTFLILFSVHPIILGSFLLVISAIIVYFRQYQYEQSV